LTKQSPEDIRLESLQRTVDCFDVVENTVDAMLRSTFNTIEHSTFLINYVKIKQKAQELDTLKEISENLRRLEN